MNSLEKSVLVIDDEENMRHMLKAMLSKLGYQVDTAADGRKAMEKVTEGAFDFILCDIIMPNMDGMAFLKSAGARLDATTVIMMSAYGSMDVAIEAMKLGAYDYISKPFKSDEVHLTLKKAEERENLRRENFFLKERIRNIKENYQFGKMVSKSKVMQSMFHLAEKVSHYDTTVLVTGESGTGKELIAKAIHFSGKRAEMPLIPVNCGGIPENLLESEFFGYKKGAFTGADRDKKGLFEEAHTGTIFLDEIGELPLTMQVKLLRALQEDEIRPIGGSKTQKIDVRVIAATSKELEKEVESGRFRQDLFYRLNVMPIRLPSLRERAEDVPLLCRHFLQKFNKRLDKRVQGFSPDAMSLFMRHDWPGNVRELENLVERAVILADGPMILPENLPDDFGAARELCDSDGLLDGYSIKKAQKMLEKRLIVKALTETRGNRTQAAELLEISHPSLLSKIKMYDIPL